MKHIKNCDLLASAKACAASLGLPPNDNVFPDLKEIVPGEEYLHEIGHFLFLSPLSLSNSLDILAELKKKPGRENRPQLHEYEGFTHDFASRSDGSKEAKAYSMSEAYAAALTVAVNRCHKAGSVRVAGIPGETRVVNEGYSNNHADHILNLTYEGWHKLVDKLARSRPMAERLKFFAQYVKGV